MPCSARWLTLGAFALASLMGCASGSAPVFSILSELTSEKWGAAKDPVATAVLNPQYRYLRVEVEGSPAALLVLGYTDAHPQGDIEVWYSSKSEVIRLQQGRIVGTSGLALNWSNVRFSVAPPVWNIERQPHGAYPAYTRVRDEIPGYRFAVTDQLEVEPWQGLPPLTLPGSLSPELARGYSWLREAASGNSIAPLPPAWFAWGIREGRPVVVYSEQCLSSSYCLKMQRWPAQEALP